MRRSWEKIPRDPIADDEELEYLYQRATWASSIEQTNKDQTSASMAESDSVEGRRKQPLPSHKAWPLRKLFS
jgi:hypothetical protein